MTEKTNAELGLPPNFKHPVPEAPSTRRKNFIEAIDERARVNLSASRDPKTQKVPLNPTTFRSFCRDFEIQLRFNQLTGKVEISGLEAVNERYATLNDDTIIWLKLRAGAPDCFGTRPTTETIFEHIRAEALNHAYHPIKDYLESLVWDKTPRLDTWLIRLAGAEDNDYVREASSLPLKAAVRRIYEPGAKFDELLVLQSPQGFYKSSALTALVPDESWFCDNLPMTSSTREVLEQTGGKWIMEVAELNGYRRAEHTQLKSFLSRRVDKCRMSYDRIASEVPRQWIAIGTTNEPQFLADTTGDRRYWPVTLKKPFQIPGVKAERDQLWAEAYHRVVLDKESTVMRVEVWPVAEKARQAFTVVNPYEDKLLHLLKDKEGLVTNATLWELLEIPVTQRHNVPLLQKAMADNGWKRGRFTLHGVQQRGFYKGNTKVEITAEKKVFAQSKNNNDINPDEFDEMTSGDYDLKLVKGGKN